MLLGLPELANVFVNLETVRGHCLAVRKWAHFSKENQIIPDFFLSFELVLA